MKKLLVLLLVFAMAFTMLASCSSCKEDPENPDNGTKDQGNTDDPAPDKDGFITVDKTYYVSAENGLNVRKAPDAEAEIVGSLPFGAEVKVTGENEDLGWFRITYLDEIAFVNATYLVTEKPEVEDPTTAEVVADDKFETVNETVYVFATSYNKETNKDVHQHDVEKINAYSRPYASDWSNKSDSWLANHASVTRVGVYYEKEDDPSYGWSKLSVVMEEGKEPVTVYVRNSQIIAELPAECGDATYSIYNNGKITFSYPKSWVKASDSGIDILTNESGEGNNISVSYEQKSDIYSKMDVASFNSTLKPTFEAAGMTITNQSVQQLKNANEIAITKIAYTASINGVSMVQTIFVVAAGDYNYCITVTEATADTNLVNNVYNTLNIVK